MSVFGDDEQDKEAEDNYSDPDGYVCSHLIQSHLDAAEAGVDAAAVGDQDHVTDRGAVEEGRVAASETGGAGGGALVGETGAPVHEAGLQPGPQGPDVTLVTHPGVTRQVHHRQAAEAVH